MASFACTAVKVIFVLHWRLWMGSASDTCSRLSLFAVQWRRTTEPNFNFCSSCLARSMLSSKLMEVLVAAYESKLLQHSRSRTSPSQSLISVLTASSWSSALRNFWLARLLSRSFRAQTLLTEGVENLTNKDPQACVYKCLRRSQLWNCELLNIEMELPDVGKHCAISTCKLLGITYLLNEERQSRLSFHADFLPFVCSQCGNTFCLEHRSFEAHNCTSTKVEEVQHEIGAFFFACNGCQKAQIEEKASEVLVNATARKLKCAMYILQTHTHTHARTHTHTYLHLLTYTPMSLCLCLSLLFVSVSISVFVSLCLSIHPSVRLFCSICCLFIFHYLKSERLCICYFNFCTTPLFFLSFHFSIILIRAFWHD